jgi:hypothetical protein
VEGILKSSIARIVGVVTLAVLAASSAPAEERAEQVKRDAAALANVKKIAVLPPVIEAGFDNKLPDPNMIVLQQEVADRLPALIADRLSGTRYATLPLGEAASALKERGWSPTDVYVTTATSAGPDNPAQTVRDSKGNVATLAAPMDTMKRSPDDMTVFTYRAHSIAGIRTGLARFRKDPEARPDLARIRQLSDKIHADSILLCQVTDVEFHGGAAGFPAHPYVSVRVALAFTLVAASDGSVLWSARSRGVESRAAFAGPSSGSDWVNVLIQSATSATSTVVSDLLDGTGRPVRR